MNFVEGNPLILLFRYWHPGNRIALSDCIEMKREDNHPVHLFTVPVFIHTMFLIIVSKTQAPLPQCFVPIGPPLTPSTPYVQHPLATPTHTPSHYTSTVPDLHIPPLHLPPSGTAVTPSVVTTLPRAKTPQRRRPPDVSCSRPGASACLRWEMARVVKVPGSVREADMGIYIQSESSRHRHPSRLCLR